jgi:hypothetical protein
LDSTPAWTEYTGTHADSRESKITGTDKYAEINFESQDSLSHSTVGVPELNVTGELEHRESSSPGMVGVQGLSSPGIDQVLGHMESRDMIFQFRECLSTWIHRVPG